jgi:UPF0755 protein
MKRWFAVIAALSAILIGGLWADYKRNMDSPMKNREIVYFEIAKGQSLKSIADGLQASGLLDKPFWFRLMAWAGDAAKRVKFGEYEIPVQTTPRQLLTLFASGKVRHYSLTFVEGWTFRQVAEAMNRQPRLTHQIEGKSPAEIMGLIGAPGEEAEGRFYPDTYFFSKGTADLDLLKRAYQKMQSVLAEEWQAKAQGLPLRNPYEALIMASIVEKETGLAGERNKIAGVFNRRLGKGMLLQTDPTVIYGMGDAYAGNIRKEDLLRDTPYNTYLHTGLPPTPISMPGLDAIRSTLHPDVGGGLYFVARGDGAHVFSNTLTEHNKAVAQFQKNRHE